MSEGQRHEVPDIARSPSDNNRHSQPTPTTSSLELPQPKPLDHSDTYLSPQCAKQFDVDSFLVSRAPGTTLAQIGDELQAFSSKLKEELNEVVDRDFRGFVNLGVALKAEGPRIARLDWKVASTSSQNLDSPLKGRFDENSSSSRYYHHKTNNLNSFEQSRYFKTDGPSRDATSNLGLESVREAIVWIRDEMRTAEDDVRRTLSEKESIEKERANLELLLSLNDSLSKLEGLLLSSEQQHTDDEDFEEATGLQDQSSLYWKSFEHSNLDLSDEEETDYSDSSDDEESPNLEPRSSVINSNQAANPNTKSRRRSSGFLAARRRSSSGLIEAPAAFSNSPIAKKPTLTLPSRIARAASEYSALMFLAEQAKSMGYEGFVEAHQNRLQKVQLALRNDLAEIVRILCSLDGASLLIGSSVGQGSSRKEDVLIEQDMLISWSQGSSLEQRRNEQATWLELAINTWLALPQDFSSDRPADTSEVEDAIKKCLIEGWASTTIDSSTLDYQMPKTPMTPHGPFVSMSDHGTFDKSFSDSTNLSSDPSFRLTYEIPYTIVGEDVERVRPLIDLYNNILTFVAERTEKIVRIAENVIFSKSISTTYNIKEDIGSIGGISSPCSDVYVRSIWRYIATRLMEQLGGKLFFVGRPEDFRRNYIVSMAFITSFEKLAPSQRAVQALRSDAIYQTFKKRWQLPVYFQMRLREVVTKLESVLTNNSNGVQSFLQHPSFPGSAKRLPILQATKAALQAFSAPWSDNGHIRELSHRQWRLSLQVLSRFRTWIQEELPSDILPAHRRVIDTSRTITAVNTPQRSSFDYQQQQRFNTSSLPASPLRPGTPTINDVDQENHLVMLCTLLAADIHHFESKAKETFEVLILSKLKQDREDDETATEIKRKLKEALGAALVLSDQVYPLLSGKVISVLKARCAEPLRLVRSVSTQYRSATTTSSMANVNGTSGNAMEPSFFVHQFLRPLKQYLGKSDSNSVNGIGTNSARQPSQPTGTNVTLSALLPQHLRQQWAHEIVEDFVIRYTASLHTMSKNFESLQRLKRNNAIVKPSPGDRNLGSGMNSGANSETGGEDSESTRMYGQMMTDVEFLEKDVKELKLIDTEVATDTPAWNRLKAAARGDLEE